MNPDDKKICDIMYYYSPDMLYREVYDQILEQSRQVGVWDEDIAILDKWLWKYKENTVEEIIDFLEPDLDSISSCSSGSGSSYSSEY